MFLLAASMLLRMSPRHCEMWLVILAHRVNHGCVSCVVFCVSKGVAQRDERAAEGPGALYEQGVASEELAPSVLNLKFHTFGGICSTSCSAARQTQCATTLEHDACVSTTRSLQSAARSRESICRGNFCAAIKVAVAPVCGNRAAPWPRLWACGPASCRT